jgi:class 3 adenylate cyclase
MQPAIFPLVFRSALWLSVALLPLCGQAQRKPSEWRSALAGMPNNEAKVNAYMEASRELTQPFPADAQEFARQALALAQRQQSKTGVVAAYSNLGLVLMNLEKFSEAIPYLEKSLDLRQKLGLGSPARALEQARDHRYQGICLEKQQRTEDALRQYEAAARYATQAQNADEMARAYNAVGEADLKLQNYQDAHRSFQRALGYARRAGMRQFMLSIEKNLAASLALLETYMETQETRAMLDTFRVQIDVVRDSLSREQETRQLIITEKEMAEIASARKDAELKAADAELKSKEAELRARDAQQQVYLLIGVAIGVVLLVFIIALVLRSREKTRSNRRLQQEKDKTQQMLHNILPVEIANELEQAGKVEPRKHEEVSILFTDFKGFTAIASQMDPAELLRRLEEVFQQFDQVIEKYGLEKIKTIGDAYMAAANLVRKDPHHAIHAVTAAMEMQEFIDIWSGKQRRKGEIPWELRIGIHTGPVVAGVIGQKKFVYDIWGDAVNLASRMEAYGEPGKVNISAATYELVRPYCDFEPKRRVEVKNRGQLDMFFVKEITALRRELPA